MFGSRVTRRRYASPEPRQLGCVALGVALQQLGDAKVQELDAPVACHENVRRFQIAMRDESSMRVADCVEDLQK